MVEVFAALCGCLMPLWFCIPLWSCCISLEAFRSHFACVCSHFVGVEVFSFVFSFMSLLNAFVIILCLVWLICIYFACPSSHLIDFLRRKCSIFFKTEAQAKGPDASSGMHPGTVLNRNGSTRFRFFYIWMFL